MQKSLSDEVAFRESEGDWATAGYLVRPVDGFRLETGLRPIVRPDEDGSAQWLVVNGDTLRRYAVARRRTLAGDFESLARDASSAAIVRFADKWGWLAQPEPLVVAGVEEVTIEPSGSGLLVGERLDYWRFELLAFKERLDVLRAVSLLGDDAADPAEMADVAEKHDALDFLARRISWERDGGVRFRAPLAGSPFVLDERIVWSPGGHPQDFVGRFKEGDVVEPARFAVYRQINAILREHIHPAVPAFTARPVMRLFTQTLLGAIYLRLALDEINLDARTAICDNCHGYFSQRSRKRRYCSDACKSAFNYHRRKAQTTVGR